MASISVCFPLAVAVAVRSRRVNLFVEIASWSYIFVGRSDLSLTTSARRSSHTRIICELCLAALKLGIIHSVQKSRLLALKPYVRI